MSIYYINNQLPLVHADNILLSFKEKNVLYQKL